MSEWDGGLWVDSKKGKPEPQYTIKQNMERIAKIDIENLEFLLKMIKNMTFDVAGGNFVNINGSILREGSIHYRSKDSEPQSSTPLELEEVFIKTDWGFIYCGIVDISQFLFIQGGLHWLWSETSHSSTMQGWKKAPLPQLTTLMIGRAVDTEWYQSESDAKSRMYGSGTYSDGEPSIHKSKYAQTRQYHMLTSGLTIQDVVDFVEAIPSFQEHIIEKYGSDKAYNQAIEDHVENYKASLIKQDRSWEPEWLDRRRTDFQNGQWRKYEESITFRGDKSIPTFIAENYGLLSDKAFYLGSGGNITMAKNEAKLLSRVEPLTGKRSMNRHTSAIAWNEKHRSGFRKGRKPKIIPNWRTSVIDPSRTTVTHYDEDEGKAETNFLYTADDIANFGIMFYQYKLSQGILNRMVL